MTGYDADSPQKSPSFIFQKNLMQLLSPFADSENVKGIISFLPLFFFSYLEMSARKRMFSTDMLSCSKENTELLLSDIRNKTPGYSNKKKNQRLCVSPHGLVRDEKPFSSSHGQ